MTGSRPTACFIMVAIALCAAVVTADRGQVQTNQAVLTSMYGDVQIRHGAAGYYPAELNELLQPNDAVKTGAGSRAELSLGEGGYVRMDENSQILVTALDAGGTTSFQALAGGVWVTIERLLGGSSKFEVHMPSAVASVKGTVFRCEVDEEGASNTYVYEGNVEVEAGGSRVKVAPEERCRVPRDLKAVVDRFNLAGDDEAAWVMYNRHRDIIRHLGNPQIMVGLREHEMPEAGAFLASKVVGKQLALHGLHSTSIANVDENSFTFGDSGAIRWHDEPRADYCVVGDVTLLQIKQLNGELFSARVRGDVHLVRNGNSTSLTSIQATVPGVGNDAQNAAQDALAALGKRIGAGLAPRIIRELMQAKMGTVRIDVSNASREQIGKLRRFITGLDGVMRTAPLVLPGDRVSLAVVTEHTPERISRAVKTKFADQVELVAAGDRVIYVRFAADGRADESADQQPPRPPEQQTPHRNMQTPNAEERKPQRPFGRNWPRH